MKPGQATGSLHWKGFGNGLREVQCALEWAGIQYAIQKKRNHELERKLAWKRLKVKKEEGRNDAILF